MFSLITAFVELQRAHFSPVLLHFSFSSLTAHISALLRRQPESSSTHASSRTAHLADASGRTAHLRSASSATGHPSRLRRSASPRRPAIPPDFSARTAHLRSPQLRRQPESSSSHASGRTAHLRRHLRPISASHPPRPAILFSPVTSPPAVEFATAIEEGEAYFFSNASVIDVVASSPSLPHLYYHPLRYNDDERRRARR